MKAKIVRIGNSQGVRIPTPLLEETGLEGDVENCDDALLDPRTCVNVLEVLAEIFAP